VPELIGYERRRWLSLGEKATVDALSVKGRIENAVILGAGSASITCDGLPKLDTISFRVGEPAELSKIVALAFGIDRDTFGYQTVQHSIEVIHLEVDHRFLCQGKVFIVLPEEGEDNLSAFGRGRKRESPIGLRQAEVFLVPTVQSFRIVHSNKRTAKTDD
jgi:hypothetical protein